MRMTPEVLRGPLHDLVAGDDRPVAVFSALWPLARATRRPVETLCDEVCRVLLDLGESRTLLMPAFAGGFNDGVCNLDEAPSQTGALTEHFRLRPGVRRSVCAFFSFAVTGPDAEEVVSLRPAQAWGTGSLYEWMYDRDVHIVTVGLHPTHCSYTHYAEWLARERIPYRYEKTFSGEVVHEGRRFPLEQTLLVRNLDPPAHNDFTWLLDTYLENGMRTSVIDGVTLSDIGARAKIDAILQCLERDPLALLENRRDFEPSCHE